MYFTTAIAIAAGLCLAFGALYLFIGVRRAAQRRLNLLFAGFAFAYAGAILGARAGYLAESLDGYATWMRVATFFAAVGFTLFAWFVAEYTSVRPRWLLLGVTAAFALVAVAAIFTQTLVVDVSAGVESVTLPWGETLLMNEGNDPPLLLVYLLALLAVVIYTISADVVQFRRGATRDAAILALGIGWFIFTLVEESLVVLGVIDTVILSDFGFLGFVVAMSLAMANRLIEYERALTAYKTNLETMVTERTAELEAVQAELVQQAEEQAATAERSRLAQELHDVVTQLLFSINLIAASLPRLWSMDPEMAERSTAELQRLTRGALAEMRTLLRELRPQTIAATDLGTLVSQLTDGLAARHDIPAAVSSDVDGDLPPDVHLALYRIAQEAMNNVAKHANASSLIVDLTDADGGVHLVVTDDGYGFDAANVEPGHMGLDIMQERASAIGAALTVTSEPETGTTVDVTWSRNG